MRLTTNIIFSMLLICVGVPALLISFYMLSTDQADQIHDLDSDEAELVRLSVSYISEFSSTNHRLPTNSEYDHWASSQPQDKLRFEGLGFSLQTKYPEDLISKFGTPPAGGYVINFLGNDAWVNYISWSQNRNTAYVSDAEYFPFGGKLKSAAFFFTIPAVIVFLWFRGIKPSALSKQ